MPQYLTNSAKETKNLAKILALEAVKTKRNKGALVFGLVGDLGSGKTTFIQGFIRGLGIKKRVTSPSFLMMRNYKLRAKNYAKVYHIDAYRIKNPKELLVLGLKEILAGPKNLVLIEWADKIKRILPKNAIWINFKYGKKENERVINIYAHFAFN